MKRVEETGVYRAKDGSAVYLAEGTMVDDAVLADLSHDAAATEENAKPAERGFSPTGTRDAEQDVDAKSTIVTRAMSAAPENKAMPPAEQKDAELADAAAKKGK